MIGHPRLRDCVDAVTEAVDAGWPEPRLLDTVGAAIAQLVGTDDWLPDAFAQPHPERYQQYLLYRDPAARFSIVSFVWGPGQQTPVHDHTVWGVIGMLRGAERAIGYAWGDGRLVAGADELTLRPGDVARVSPAIGDIHRVANLYDDRVSISIHCYGADIGQVQRHVFDAASGAAKSFVSGYANPP